MKFPLDLYGSCSRTTSFGGIDDDIRVPHEKP